MERALGQHRVICLVKSGHSRFLWCRYNESNRHRIEPSSKRRVEVEIVSNEIQKLNRTPSVWTEVGGNLFAMQELDSLA